LERHILKKELEARPIRKILSLWEIDDLAGGRDGVLTMPRGRYYTIKRGVSCRNIFGEDSKND